MNDPHAIDDERAAQITERIGETFEFMRDVLDDPTILEEIPDGAQIELRTVVIGEHDDHIVAFRSENTPTHWVARTTGRAHLDGVDDRQFWVSIRLQSSVSAEAAMDSVESALRAAEATEQLGRQIA